jgi:hypothetical protein
VDEDTTVMGLLAKRFRMTEGQLYTAIITVAVAALLTFTGLPNAHRRPPGLPTGGASIPTLAPTTVPPPQPTSASTP